MRKNYALLDTDGKVVLGNTTIACIARYLGVSNEKVRYSVDTGWLLKDRYEVETEEPGDIEKDAKDVILTVCGEQVSFVKVWNDIRRQLGKGE